MCIIYPYKNNGLEVRKFKTLGKPKLSVFEKTKCILLLFSVYPSCKADIVDEGKYI
jgi:hypothetical protein